jgi:hypothetical protein
MSKITITEFLRALDACPAGLARFEAVRPKDPNATMTEVLEALLAAYESDTSRNARTAWSDLMWFVTMTCGARFEQKIWHEGVKAEDAHPWPLWGCPGYLEAETAVGKARLAARVSVVRKYAPEILARADRRAGKILERRALRAA